MPNVQRALRLFQRRVAEGGRQKVLEAGNILVIN